MARFAELGTSQMHEAGSGTLGPQADRPRITKGTEMKHVRTTVLVLVLAAVAFAGMAGTALAQDVPVTPGSAPIAAFPPPTNCQCHAQYLKDWTGSMHAKAIADPLFQAKMGEANAATGNKLGEFCLKCHAPIATMAGEVQSGQMSQAGAVGVGCMFCHQVTGTTEPIGNVSQLVMPDTTRRAQLAQPQAPHPAVESPFHATSEICGGCHNVMHPGNGMHLESTYKEWSESPQAKEGIQCQDCHMSDKPGTVGPYAGTAANGGPQRDNLYRMTFVGAQVGQATDPSLPKEMLKSAATVELDAPEILKPGEDTSVTVTVTNVGAGHYLPTGLTEVREMWLEVSLVGADGKATKLGEHKFGTELQDAKGNHPVELWDATGVFSDDRIPPKGSVKDGYAVKLAAADSAGTLVAELKYRSAPEALATKAGVDNPTTVMAAAKQAVYGSEDAKQQTEAAEKAAEQSGTGSNITLVWILAIVAAIAVGIAAFVVVRSRSGK